MKINVRSTIQSDETNRKSNPLTKILRVAALYGDCVDDPLNADVVLFIYDDMADRSPFEKKLRSSVNHDGHALIAEHYQEFHLGSGWRSFEENLKRQLERAVLKWLSADPARSREVLDRVNQCIETRTSLARIARDRLPGYAQVARPINLASDALRFGRRAPGSYSQGER